MFPNFQFNPLETDVASIVPGDLVSFRVADDDPSRIISISASANYIARYGRIREFRPQGGFYDILMEFGNGQTAWFTFVDNILVLENGRPVQANRIQIGDWARILINQAIIGPGIMMESIREIALDSGGHHITAVVQGQLAGHNPLQNQISIRNAQTLTPAGWSNNQPLAQFNIGGRDIVYFFDGRQVDLNFLNRYLQRSDATVYLALENNFAGAQVRKVSVRTGRDELLQPDTVLSASQGTFSLLEIGGPITTDPGTIVVRNNRLVSPTDIFAPDWATVSLNGQNSAAVVNISQPPATAGVQIARGRIAQVWPHQGFRVETMSIFDGLRWAFTPIPAQFTIDHDTLFIGPGGVTSIDDFLGYTEGSVIGDVFNIIIEGGRATRVISAPFTEPIPPLVDTPGHLAIRGTIFDAGGTLQLRDVMALDGRTMRWTSISATNATATVNLFPNTIIVDRDQVVGSNSLQVGQQVMVFTPTRRDAITIGPGMAVDGYIVLVES
jgi:hypothetical protein